MRRLNRTSLPIPHAGGTYPAKSLTPILGGILTLESDWSPALGKSLKEALEKHDSDNILNLGCVAAHGHFVLNQDQQTYELFTESKPATVFLFNLISMLQHSGTVPMIDIQAYARWLSN